MMQESSTLLAIDKMTKQDFQYPVPNVTVILSIIIRRHPTHCVTSPSVKDSPPGTPPLGVLLELFPSRVVHMT